MLPVIHVLGSMLMMFSVTYVLPIATALIYADGHFARLHRGGGCLPGGRGAALGGNAPPRSASCARATVSCS